MSIIEALASPQDFLDLCRTDSFDQTLQHEIDNEIADLVSKVAPKYDPSQTKEMFAPEYEHLEENAKALKFLGELKRQYLTIQSLREKGNLENALVEVDTARQQNAEFQRMYPHATLNGDLEIQINTLESLIYADVTAKWKQLVNISKTDTEIVISVKPELQDVWSLFEMCEPRNRLIQTFILDFGEAIQLIADLGVDDVGDTETSVALGLGPAKTVEILIYTVQTFVLSCSSILIPQLYEKVARKYGHRLSEQIMNDAIPKLYPKDPNQYQDFSAEVRGLKGLEELLTSIDWYKGVVLTNYTENFDNKWLQHREGIYLDRLRALLSKVMPVPAQDEWDWDGDEEETEEVEQDADSAPNETVIDIISAFVAETNHNIDHFLTLYRAMSPHHYPSKLQLYTDGSNLISAISNLPHSEDASQKLLEFIGDQLAVVLKKFAAEIEPLVSAGRIACARPSLGKQIVDQVDKIAQESTLAGPETRQHILVDIVERIAVDVIRGIESCQDITEEQCSEQVAFIDALNPISAFFRNISDQVPSWIKLQRLREILNSNLSDIRNMYERHMLNDFSGQELENLIIALFVDSDQRQELIEIFIHGNRGASIFG